MNGEQLKKLEKQSNLALSEEYRSQFQQDFADLQKYLIISHSANCEGNFAPLSPILISELRKDEI